jgi:cell division transport system ATP-binding protein
LRDRLLWYIERARGFIYVIKMIEFKEVTKRYGHSTVLDKVSLTIQPGEFVSVIGPSGAGKSTLVYALIGAEKIQHGEIIVDGYVVNKMKEKGMQYYRRRIGVVFQDYKLLQQKSVYENVAFAMEVCDLPRAEIKKRVPEVLEIVGLGKKGKQFPHQLSGGERQRAALARALVHNPSLIVADEPTGNLDPKTAKEIINLLLKINGEGTTVILTTHNKELVDHINGRVITLEDGKIAGDRRGGYDK